MSTSILVTGNRGFIASGLDLENDGLDIKDGADILTYKAEKKYDVVVHTAALTSVTESMREPQNYFRTNVEGTFNIVKQHPESHFVYLSTVGVYGEGMYHTVKTPVNPPSVYCLTKYLGEEVVRFNAKSYLILRLTNVIGEKTDGEPNVYQVFQKEEELSIYGDGFQTRDFIRVEKVRQAIKSLYLEKGIYNIGSGLRQSILDLASNFKKPIKFLPARHGEIRHSGVDDAFDFDSE